jgi:hypothetical protein
VYRLFKWLVTLAFVALLLSLGSYAVARLKVGSYVGPMKPLTGHSTHFAFDGVRELNGRRFVWVVDYRSSKMPGVSRAKFFVSPTGDLISVIPRDLDRHIEAWEKTQLP